MHKHGGDIYQYPDYIDFSANINLLGAPPGVLERVKSAADEILHYPQPGSGKLCRAIAELEKTEPEQVFCGNGAAEVIFSLALAEKPGKALLFAPAFQEYEQALKSVGCEIIREYLGPEQGFLLQEKNLLQITPEIDMVFLCNPNNPTGILTGPGMLERLAERCSQAGAVLAVDECFLDFADPKQAVFSGSCSREEKSSLELYTEKQGHAPASCSMKKYLKKYPNLFIIKAFTKTFGMPGIRLGYGLCGNEARLSRMREVTQPWNVSVLAQEAGIAAAKEAGFLEETRRAVEREKAFLLEHLQKYQRQHKIPPGMGKAPVPSGESPVCGGGVFLPEAGPAGFPARQTTVCGGIAFPSEAGQSLIPSGENPVLERGAFPSGAEPLYIQIYGHAANFIFFRSRKGLAADLEKHKILIRDCSNFLGLSEGWYRIAVRTRKENEILLRALEHI